MSHKLTIEMSDRAYGAIEREAATRGTTPSVVAASTLEQRFAEGNGAPGTDMNEADKEKARLRFESHFGSLSLPGVILSDNEPIDVDLAREYGSSHQEE